MVLDKCATADQSPVGVSVGECPCLWWKVHEEDLVAGEGFVPPIYNGEDCTHPHYIITILKDVLNSINSDLSTVVF